MNLILSLFPGIGLLDMAFEEIGFCVVRGPDTLWGGDIRKFHPPSGIFWGVIGGPPCQDFSSLRRSEQTGNGLEMLGEFSRVVTEAKPEWWLMENVARVPNVTKLGHIYAVQRFDINLAWYCDRTRLRHIQFGSMSGRFINVIRRPVTPGLPGAALANDDRSFAELCRLQGLPDNFDLPPFLASEKKRAVGNGVPLPMGRILAEAIKEAYSKPVVIQRDLAGHVTQPKTCACGCGRQVTGKARYYDYSCRKRAERNRTGKSQIVTDQVSHM
jgi:DNA (cytosine-5)-methyltransferase 1